MVLFSQRWSPVEVGWFYWRESRYVSSNFYIFFLFFILFKDKNMHIYI